MAGGEATTDMTQMSRAFDPKTIFQSTAALPIVKIKNVKSHMGEDVFRIFRKTMNDVRGISNQHEKEQNRCLKSSYLEKNLLYKELAGISLLKDTPSMQRRKTCLEQNMGNIYREEIAKLQEIRRASSLVDHVRLDAKIKQKPHTEKVLSPRVAVEYEKSKMFVNKLKRCECCKSLAMRIKEHYQRKIEEEEGIKAEQEELEIKLKPSGKKLTESRESRAPNRSKGERKNRKTSKGDETEKGETGAVIQRKTSQDETADMKQSTPGNRNTKHSFPAIRKQCKLEIQQVHGSTGLPQRCVDIDEEAVNQSSSQSQIKRNEKSPLLRSQTCPAILGNHDQTTSRSRKTSRIVVKLPPAPNARVKLGGQAWQDHLSKLQNPRTSTSNASPELDDYHRNANITKAYLRFRRALLDNRPVREPTPRVQLEDLGEEDETSQDEGEHSSSEEEEETTSSNEPSTVSSSRLTKADERRSKTLDNSADLKLQEFLVKAGDRRRSETLDFLKDIEKQDLDCGTFSIEEGYEPLYRVKKRR